MTPEQREKYNAYHREYYHRNKEKLQAQSKARGEYSYERHKASKQRYNEAHKNDPEYKQKRRARGMLYRAMRRGEITRPSECPICGEECTVQAHHHNGYDDEHALDVIWCCQKCHTKLEKEN